jgi:hypothetical protein
MTSLNHRADIYDPKTLAAMDQAFAAVWHMLRANDPFRDYANDAELRMAMILSGSEISPWRACFCHVIESRGVSPSPPSASLSMTGVG